MQAAVSSGIQQQISISQKLNCFSVEIMHTKHNRELLFIYILSYKVLKYNLKTQDNESLSVYC